MKISFIILVFLSGMISGVVIWEVRDDIYNEAVEDKKELIEPEIADTDKKELIHQEKIKVLDRKVMELTDALNISKAYQAKEHSPIKDNKLKKIRVLTLGMLLDSGIKNLLRRKS